MDSILGNLVHLSKQFRKAKKQFLDYSAEIKNTFNLSDDQIPLVSFGIIETCNPSLQKYVDILNNDQTINKLNDKVKSIKFEGIITILEYALECDEKISGYDLNILLKNPIKNREEISSLFEGLAGVHHIHVIDGKIMMELPSRGYVIKNRRLLKYVDFWNKELQKAG
jgi:hypothetical protein